MANKPAPLNTSSLTMTFDDEFNTFNASPDGSAGWMTQYPFWGASRTLAMTHEAEYLSDSSTGVNPFSLSNGVLDITATAAPSGSNPLNLPYNSGAITTYKSFSQLYGYFEVRAELPTGQGLWPAFWMLPTNGQSATELDIFEVLGNSPTTMHSTTHSSVAGAGLSQAFQVPDTSTGFHTYGVDWEPDTITFYMDGKVVATTATPSDMNVPMYMLLTLAVGGAGSWPGATNASTKFPATMQVDYVHAYATPATIGLTDTNPPAVPAAVLPAVTAHAPAGTGWIGATLLHYGNQDPGSRQAGVGVALLNASGQVVATAVTDSNGTVQFLHLGAGTYQVRYITPPSLLLQPGSQADTATGLTAPIKLGAGQGLPLIHQTVLSAAHLRGSVTLAGGPQAGVAVALLNAARAVVATATTDAQGGFGFYVPAGTYSVQYLPPAGEAVMVGGHASLATGIGAPIGLLAGQSFLLEPQPLVGNPAALAGSVLLASATTAGEPGVGVTLLSAGGSVVATATTDGSGAFGFANLAPGTYQLRYALPPNTLMTAASAADPATGLTATFTVQPGQSLTLPVETLLPAPATLNGTVLFSGGAGEAGVAVTLLAGGRTVAAATTDGRGAFSFANLAAGTYQVRYAAPAAEAPQSGPAASGTGLTGTLTLAAGQVLTLAAETMAGTLGTVTGSATLAGAGLAGATVRLLDGTGTTTLATATTNATGAYHFTGLATGYYRVQLPTPAGDLVQGGPVDATGKTAAFSVTAGATRTVGAVAFAAASDSIGGTVVLDGTGVAGAAVALVDAGGGTLATRATDASGAFSFANVTPGTYQIRYAAPANTVLGTGSAANPANGFSAPFALANGQTLRLAAETLAHASPAAPHASVGQAGDSANQAAVPTPPAAVKGRAMFVASPAAAPTAEAGVAVSLLRADGSVAATTRSGADGTWGFSGVAVGAYRIRYTMPDWQVAVAGTTSSGSANAQGITDAFTLAPGQLLAMADERFTTPPASLAGSLLHYGQGDAGTGQAGVAVTLLDGQGRVLATTTSNGDGGFSFGNLNAGTYQVRYAAPGWETFQARPADPAPGLSPQVALVAGQQLTLTHETLLSTSNSFVMTGTGQAVRGDGSYTVTGDAAGSRLTLGRGNQSVTLTGSGDTVTVGAGSSTIAVGPASTVHAAGGLINTTTITASGGGNTLDGGSGAVFLRTDGSAGNTFLLNAVGRGLTTVSGFNMGTSDVLDLSRTLAGLGFTSAQAIGADVTATAAHGDTTLWVDPTGGHAAPSAFAVLSGVTTTVGQLAAGHHISLGG